METNPGDTAAIRRSLVREDFGAHRHTVSDLFSDRNRHLRSDCTSACPGAMAGSCHRSVPPRSSPPARRRARLLTPRAAVLAHVRRPGLPGANCTNIGLGWVRSVSARKAAPDEVGYLAAKSSNTNLVSCPDHLEAGAFLPLPCRLAGCEHLWYRPFTVWPRKINSWVACPVRSKCLLRGRYFRRDPDRAQGGDACLARQVKRSTIARAAG